MSGKLRLRGRLVVVALTLLVIDQALQYTVFAGGTFAGRPIAPFDPPIFNGQQEVSLVRIRAMASTSESPLADVRFDAELGWCCAPESGSGDFTYDWAGCRTDARAFERVKPPGVTRVVAVGGSFTRGDEVAPLECWPALIESAREDLAVGNLGMGAYGADQALLRLRRDGLPLEPDEVWLGYFPQASLRTLNVYRPALRHWSPAIAFKPRFRLDDGGELELLPNPVRDLAEIPPLMASQEDFLAAVGTNDFWVERARRAYLPRGSSWMHHFATTRVLLTLHEKGERSAAPWVEDPEQEVRRLLLALMRETAREARAAGAILRVIVVPGRDDLALRERAGGTGYWSGLVSELLAEGIDVIDASQPLVEAGAVTDDALWMPGGHYAPPAHEIVARAIEMHLAR